jgi:hypothetical protein
LEREIEPSKIKDWIRMNYLFAALIIEGIVCTIIQINLIKLIQVRFSQKWIEWGKPHPFSPNPKSGIKFMRLVMSNALIELGDFELAKMVRWIRCMWGLFMLTFVCCITIFFILLVKAHWK